jgi:SAM-dependent methyltransferase
MKTALLTILRCPSCSGELALKNPREAEGEIESGELACGGCPSSFPIVRFIPRFVPVDSFQASFGFQWNEFRRTQLDSHTGLPLSGERFRFSTGWPTEHLKGRRVLDVGCGAGRFAEVALSAGAELVALDYSSAVDACRQNLGPHPRLDVVQGDVYALPFKKGCFDFAYCLGVLQHTPDVRRAFLSLPDQLRPGGQLAVDVYPKLLLNLLWPKYWLRPLTKRLPQPTLFAWVKVMVRFLLPVSLWVGRIPVVGRKLRYAIPVVNHEPDFPLSPQQVREWAILNTYDMLAPVHDHPQSAKTLAGWFQEAGLRNVEVFRKGHLIGRAVKATR